MASATLFVGDELSAAGFRLCGVDVRVPASGDEAACLEEAIRQGSMVLLGARCARAMAPTALEAALALLAPMVMVVPDWDGTALDSEPANRVRQVLGLEA
jgi:vacuolar-type H+-ATPase subunit F/Vma7